MSKSELKIRTENRTLKSELYQNEKTRITNQNWKIRTKKSEF